jgi:hypothetical protein
MILQDLKIIFEVQNNNNNNNNNNKKKNKLSNLRNSFLWTPPTFKSHNFLISC